MCTSICSNYPDSYPDNCTYLDNTGFYHRTEARAGSTPRLKIIVGDLVHNTLQVCRLGDNLERAGDFVTLGSISQDA